MTNRAPSGIDIAGIAGLATKPALDAVPYRWGRPQAATSSEALCDDHLFETIGSRSEGIAMSGAALDPLANSGFILVNSSLPTVYGTLARKLEHRGSGDVSAFGKCTIVGWSGYARSQTREPDQRLLKTLSLGRDTTGGSQADDAPSELKKERAKAELARLLLASNIEDSDGAADLRDSLTTFLLRFGAAAVSAMEERLSRIRLASDQHIFLLDVLASIDDPDTLTIRTYALGKALVSSDPAMRHKAASCLSEMGTELAKRILRDHLGVETNTLVRQRIELELA